MTSAKFVGDAVDDIDIESRTGFSFGGWLAVPLGDRVSIVPGATYVQKGTQFDEFADVTATFELAYLEIPVLFSVRLTPAESSTAINLFAGPSIAFEVSCSLSATDGDDSVSEDCDAEADERESMDFSGIIGGGVGFPINEGLGLNISAGLDMGLTSLDASEDSEDIKNRTFFGSVALTIPVGG